MILFEGMVLDYRLPVPLLNVIMRNIKFVG